MVDRCARCGGELLGNDGRYTVLSRWLERPVCTSCWQRLHAWFAGALAVLGTGVAFSPLLLKMPIWLFVLLGGGLVLASGLVFWWSRQVGAAGLTEPDQGRWRWLTSPLAEDAGIRFHVTIFGAWLASYYVANLACGEWNPLAVGCNETCQGLMWGSLGSMSSLAAAYMMGYRRVAWLMLGITGLQNYPHCQCDNGFYIPALQVQPFCFIVTTLVGLTSLWMMSIGRFKSIGFALTLSLLAGAFAVAATHRLGVPILWRLTL